jgi:CRISPR-associated protein (TIGR03986 family)
MNSKKSEAVIYERDPDAKPLPLTDEQVDAYTEQVSKEQEKLLGKKGVLNDGQPVFYIEEKGKVIFFGHARMFRVPYPRSPFEYVPEELRASEEPKDPTLVDFTEAMFGYTRKVGSKRERAYAGRISCSDAELIPQQKEIWLSQTPVTPQILSGPKPTTFQHYLVQKEPDLYEAGRTKDGAVKYETRLRDYGDATPGETVIRGHKFYWHKGAVGLVDIKENGLVKEGDTQHTHFHPLRAGVKFQFKVYFDNLNAEELGAMMWVLSLASDEHLRLKIGMGKPLGMGAVAIRPKLFLEQPEKRYSTLLEDGSWTTGVKEDQGAADAAVRKFIAGMDQNLGEKFVSSQRIQALLTMLLWPGPDYESSRYMEIEYPDPQARKGKRNEYKERPVLPTPHGVWLKKKK